MCHELVALPFDSLRPGKPPVLLMGTNTFNSWMCGGLEMQSSFSEHPSILLYSIVYNNTQTLESDLLGKNLSMLLTVYVIWVSCPVSLGLIFLSLNENGDKKNSTYLMGLL